MSLQQLLESRFSTRAFQKKPVEKTLLQEIFRQAGRSPSNCNVQPWQPIVVSGETRDRLSQALVKEVSTRQAPNPDFNWTVKYQNAHRERQFGSASALYDAMGIAREDRMARNIAMLRNWQFFDAPHAVFFVMEKYLDIMGAVDLGIYAQTLALVLEEQGISSCMQGALGQFPDPVREEFDLPESVGVLFGMSFGYADPDHPANNARTVREDLTTLVSFYD